ncbi:MAG: DUF421 domain-containing protein [Rhizobiaceae bacterium]|nr:MAG: DUF421 domain-containing protein [Rhizobiaceae bacterium]
MNILTALFGVEHQVSFWQECARAVLIFVYGLILLRASGKRTFGHWSALDIIVSVVVGSILGRALTGSAPLPGTLAAVFVLVGLHVLFSYAVANYHQLARFIEGRPVTLIRDGQVDHRTRIASMISLSDINEALRSAGLQDDEGFGQVKLMTLEPNGEISVIKREKST